VNLTEVERKECFRLYNDHMALMSTFCCFKPKHHVIYHILEKSIWFGNPTLYDCWLDESLNKNLKAACRMQSQLTFEPCVLFAMRKILRPN